MDESAMAISTPWLHSVAPEGKDRSKAALPATADYVQIHLDGDLSASHSVLDPARSDRSLAATSMASPSPTSSECRSGRAIIRYSSPVTRTMASPIATTHLSRKEPVSPGLSSNTIAKIP